MTRLRTALALALGAIGLYYATRAAVVLLTVSDVASWWLLPSRDPDFPADAPIFSVWIGVGAGAVLLFGLTTVIAAWRTVTGVSTTSGVWTVLAFAAPVIHWPWFLFRSIALGTLTRSEQTAIQHDVAIRFGVVCLAYILLAVLTRAGHVPSPRPRASFRSA